jgi:hypothetical protein
MPSMPKTESPTEAAARSLVESGLTEDRGCPVTLEFWDDGAHGDGQQDYWIGPGRWGALEVTTLADTQQANAQWMWAKYGPKADDRVAGLDGSWSLLVDQAIKPRPLMAEIRSSLPEAERMGITSIPWSPTATAPLPVLRLAAAGVKYGSRFEVGKPGMVTIARSTAFGPRPPEDPNHLVTALDEALTTRSRGDVDKLMRAQTRERHVFFWISPMTRLDVLLAIGEGMPTCSPSLPVEITDLWVAVVDRPALHWSVTFEWHAHHHNGPLNIT